MEASAQEELFKIGNWKLPFSKSGLHNSNGHPQDENDKKRYLITPAHVKACNFYSSRSAPPLQLYNLLWLICQLRTQNKNM